MPVSGQPSPSTPAVYRMVLALSVAALAHTLVLASLAEPTSEPALTHTLAFELASRPSAASEAATPGTAEPRHQPFEAPALRPAPDATAPIPQPAERPQPTSKPDNHPVNAAALPREASEARPNPMADVSPVRQVSESPDEKDPYLRKLATHLALTLDDQRVPSISSLRQTAAVTLELRLLANGALTRARVVDSTGFESLDKAAYKAALAASPYPAPEGEASDRFRVQLLFTPKRS